MKPLSPLHVFIALIALGLAHGADAEDIECETSGRGPRPYCEFDTLCATPGFWFEAESVAGVPGDVIPVSISLRFSDAFDFSLIGLKLTVCHDPAVAEIVGGPVYLDELLARNPVSLAYYPVDQDEDPGNHAGYGFISLPGPLEPRQSAGGTLPIMTVYYRILGASGDSTEIAFCDGGLRRFESRCNLNTIDEDFAGGAHIVSTRNQNGLITVHDGPVTRPERPPEPPPAIVYPEPPTSEEVDLRVRIGNVVAVPGARDVPVDVFVTADVEYTGVVVPIDFDERYVRVSRVEDNFLSGRSLIDNEDATPGAQADEGYVVIASSLGGTRRIAAAGEEFFAARVYLDVLETAAAIEETTLEARSVGGLVPDPLIVVRHRVGEVVEEVEATSEFGAVEISGGFVAIRASLETMLGDANFDGAFDIADPVAVLGYLFQGRQEPLCPPAADYNRDGRLVISDAIRMLGVLFLGQEPPATGAVARVECR